MSVLLYNCHPFTLELMKAQVHYYSHALSSIALIAVEHYVDDKVLSTGMKGLMCTFVTLLLK